MPPTIDLHEQVMANLIPAQVPTVNEIQVYRQKSSTTELDVL